jgi:hypothetical protein
MRVLIFAALSASVFAAEVSLQSQVSTLRTALNSLDVSRETRESGIILGRKLIVEKMLAQVESMGSFSPASQTLLQDAADAARNILGHLATERDNTNAILAGLVAEFANCLIASAHTTMATMEATADGLAADHVTCRELWETQHATFMADCATLHTITTSIASGLPANNQNGCDRSGLNAHQSDGDAWAAMATHGHGQIVTGSHNKAAYDTAAAACEAANNAVVSTDSTCDTDQNAYEVAYCAWGNYVIATCNTQHSCYDGKVTALDNANAAEVAPSAQRVEDARVINTLVCYLEYMATANAPLDYASMQSGCDYSATDYSSYMCDTPTAPARDACVYPAMHGDPDWVYDSSASWFSRLTATTDCNFTPHTYP